MDAFPEPPLFDDGLIDQCFEYGPDRIMTGRHKLSKEKADEFFLGVNPECRAGGADQSVFAWTAQGFRLRDIHQNREAKTETISRDGCCAQSQWQKAGRQPVCPGLRRPECGR